MQINDMFVRMGLIILAAAAGEGVIEFIPGPILDWLCLTDKIKRTVVLNTLSAILGVVIAWNFNLGMFSLLGATGKLVAADEIITGVLVGRGSNYIHGIIRNFIIGRIQP